MQFARLQRTPRSSPGECPGSEADAVPPGVNKRDSTSFGDFEELSFGDFKGLSFGDFEELSDSFLGDLVDFSEPAFGDLEDFSDSTLDDLEDFWLRLKPLVVGVVGAGVEGMTPISS